MTIKVIKIIFIVFWNLTTKQITLVFLVFSTLSSAFAAMEYNTQEVSVESKKTIKTIPLFPRSIEHQNLTRRTPRFFGKDYEFIFFYSSYCPHCMKFEPVLRYYSNYRKIPVRAFSIDGSRSKYFPNDGVATKEIIEQFFGYYDKKTSLYVPTLFILNKNNLHAYPISQGELSLIELYWRMSDQIPRIINYEKYGSGDSNG